MVGGPTLESSWSVLGKGGRIVTLVEFDIESREDHAGEAVFFASATPYLQEAVRQFRAGKLQARAGHYVYASLRDVRKTNREQ